MSSYLLAGLVILLANVMPAFAPPTWSILVYFVFREHMNAALLVLIGVSCATLGRGGLALAFRKISPMLPRGYVANLERLGSRVNTDSRSARGLLLLFFVSPITSAQLFEAAGIIKQVALAQGIRRGFDCGRKVHRGMVRTGRDDGRAGG